MSEAKFTKGECIAEIIHIESDAHLIAAAPEMYRMLDAIATLRMIPTEEKLSELLAKARGES